MDTSRPKINLIIREILSAFALAPVFGKKPKRVVGPLGLEPRTKRL
jgi:hypothetical protein